MNKSVLVTGGSRGIGRAIVLMFAEAGMDVAINYAGNVAAAESVKIEAEALGVKAVLVQGDVSCTADVERVVEQTIAVFGKIDILINNAGITRDRLMRRMTEEDWDAVLDTNLKGMFLMTKAVSGYMLKARTGTIINISAVVGVLGNIGQVNYAAAKAGAIGLTKSVARELAGRGIRVNAVAPGFIETDMTACLSESVKENLLAQIPLRSLGDANDIAAAVKYLASDDAKYITGQVLQVNGGMAM